MHDLQEKLEFLVRDGSPPNHATMELTATRRASTFQMIRLFSLRLTLGLEQTVVYFHHRHQLQEARGELAGELESNRRVVHINLERRHMAGCKAERVARPYGTR